MHTQFVGSPIHALSRQLLADIISHIGGSAYLSGTYDDIIHGRSSDRELPSFDMSPTEFAGHYMAYNLVRKCSTLNLGIDTAERALVGWKATEDHCKYLNRHHGVNPHVTYNALDGITLEAVIHTASCVIRDVLGPLSLNEVFSHAGFSGGASTTKKRAAGHPYYKFAGVPATTSSCFHYAVAAVKAVPLWHDQIKLLRGDNPLQWFKVERGSRLTTVPKTSKIDRPIAIEPDMNMFIQRGIGGVIRSRLRRVGIDLNDQSRNSAMALVASVHNLNATIDLSAASDSISYMLVESLLPIDWVRVISDTRSSHCRMPDGSWHELEKVSSMGNGYTFELESLIFYSLAKAVLLLQGNDAHPAVYGDDIIVPSSSAELLISALEYCGFATNKDKTFVDGPFRESCGSHGFLGLDVTPFNVKDQLGYTPGDLYWFFNSTSSWAARTNIDVSRTLRLTLRYLHTPGFTPQSFGLRSGINVPEEITSELGLLNDFQYASAKLVPRRKKHRPNGIAAVIIGLTGLPDDILQIEKGDPKEIKIKYKISWWDSMQWPTWLSKLVLHSCYPPSSITS